MIGGAILTLIFLARKVFELYYRVQQKVLYDTLPELEKKKPNLYEKIHKKFLTELIIFAGSVIVGMAVVIVIAVLYNYLQENFEWYQNCRMCTSETMREWIDVGYMKYFDQEQRNCLLCIILVLSLILLDIMMFLWRNFKGDLRK